MKFFIKKHTRKVEIPRKEFIVYIRVSTKGQVDKDDIPMQRLKCNEFAKA